MYFIMVLVVLSHSFNVLFREYFILCSELSVVHITVGDGVV
jgi:hypothetical protein